jgi:ABC-type glycerol-3-phosphate transport system substrate-binding protein
MKRIMVLITLALVAVMVLAACSQQPDQTTETVSAQPSESASAPAETGDAGQSEAPAEASLPPVDPEVNEDTAVDATDYLEWKRRLGWRNTGG